MFWGNSATGISVVDWWPVDGMGFGPTFDLTRAYGERGENIWL